MLTDLKDRLSDWWEDLTQGRTVQATIACADEDVELANAIRMQFINDGVPCSYHSGVKTIEGQSQDGQVQNVYTIEPGTIGIMTMRAGGLLRGPTCRIQTARFTRA